MIHNFIHTRCNHRASKLAAAFSDVKLIERTETTATLRGSAAQERLYYVKYWSFTNLAQIERAERDNTQ